MSNEITDAAIAHAFRERLESMYSPLTVREVMKAVEARARELDAEKGGEAELPGMWSKSDFTGGDPDERSHAERDGLTEAQKVERDAYLYGTGFMRDGKHIPAQEVMVSCRHDWATDGMGDYCRYCKRREDTYTPPAQAAESVQVASNPGAGLSNEAVERVARAIAAVNNGHPDHTPQPTIDAFWGLLDADQQDRYRRMARAAIAAMQAGEGK